MAFNHENLNVYQRMLPFNVKVGIWTGEWDSKHAICDRQNLLPRDEVVGWKALLERVSAMTAAMIAGIQR